MAAVSEERRNPWLTTFRNDPANSLDLLLRGLTRIPPYERATPSEILKRLFGPLPIENQNLKLLDDTLVSWLSNRWHWTTENLLEYGVSRFITEFGDALSVIWLLPLNHCKTWIQENYLELAQWASPLRLSRAWDLPRELANAAALTQFDDRLRFVWFRLCAEAASPSKRSLIAPALTGMSMLPATSGHGASKELIAGLARFGAGLTDSPEDQAEFLRQWRALKVRFPRIPMTWRKLWHEALTNRQYVDKPFRAWLTKNDIALDRPLDRIAASTLPTRQQLLNVLSHIQTGDRQGALQEATLLLHGYEQYAESTGDSDYFVLSACKVATAVLPWAPGHTLAWSRQALRWTESYAPAWSLRARALVALKRKDLAQAVLWEAVRRLPGEAFVRTQLALLLEEQGNYPESEALLREAISSVPLNPGACVELARLLDRVGRNSEAEETLRIGMAELPDNSVLPHTLINLLISWGRLPEAALARDRFVRDFGDERSKIETLNRLISAGAASVEKVRSYLRSRTYQEEGLELPIEADVQTSEAVLKAEVSSREVLLHASRASHADILFRLSMIHEAEAQLGLALDGQTDDSYARIVWALHDPGRRSDLAARFQDSYGLLAPHLASASPSTPESVWARLQEQFPERIQLIEFARLIRSGRGGNARDVLELASAHAQRESDVFLRQGILGTIGSDGAVDPESPLQHRLLDTAIRAEAEIVDVGLLRAA